MEMIKETKSCEKELNEKTEKVKSSVEKQNKNAGKVRTWVKTHKAGIKTACVIVIVAAGSALLYENWSTIRKVIRKPKRLQPVAAIPAAATEPVQAVLPATSASPVLKETIVRLHPRTLSGGRHPSPEKLAQAAALGLSLAENQTFVSEHPRHYVA